MKREYGTHGMDGTHGRFSSSFSLFRPFSLFRILVLLPCLCICSLTQDAGSDGIRITTIEELKSEFGSVPCKNDDRQQGVKELFEKLGADPAEIAVDKYKHVENLVIRRPGASPETASQKIVIGAHYDK